MTYHAYRANLLESDPHNATIWLTRPLTVTEKNRPGFNPAQAGGITTSVECMTRLNDYIITLQIHNIFVIKKCNYLTQNRLAKCLLVN